MKYKRIYLVGFRGTGKSTFGKTLAKNLGFSFLDMDFLISQEAGKDLNVLTKNGTDWIKFRELENRVLLETVEMENVVISCGGGVGVNNIFNKRTGKTFGELNKEILKSSKENLIILLTAGKKIIEERLKKQFLNKKIMPFLDKVSAKEAEAITSEEELVKKQVNDSMKILDEREKSYEDLADFEINTSNFYLPENLVNLNIVIGDPVEHSLSPVMHNVGYKALGIDNANLFIAIKVKKEKLSRFIEAIKVLGIKGISVTVPHKEAIIKYLDDLDSDAKKIGAVNTILNKDGKLIGSNTDWIGAIKALEKKTNLNGKTVAVIGAGGAARAIVFGLIKKGARVKIFNRTLEAAKKIADEFSVEYGEMGQSGEIRDYEIIINATSVGMNEEKNPLSKDLINKNQIIFDIVYSSRETMLIRNAKEKGAKIVYGYEMLLYQGVEQFKVYTGLEAPVKEMEEALIANL